MPNIQLFELGPTRSARARWMLAEAGLDFESIGNDVSVFDQAELKAVHPLSKLPAARIDGQPLFESAAIVTAVADLVPERRLIAAPGTWERNLHYQWMSFALTEIEAHLQSSEINRIDFILKPDEHVPEIIPQNTRWALRGLAVLDEVLRAEDYLVGGQFSATDVMVGYTVSWAEEDKLLGETPNLVRYLERLRQREHCTLIAHG